MEEDKSIIAKLIRSVNLKATKSRLDVLELFYTNKHALSYADIDAYLLGKEDKATVYRTLKSFSEKGLIHEVFDGDKTTKYALCGSECGTSKHHDYHAHFKCTICFLLIINKINKHNHVHISCSADTNNQYKSQIFATGTSWLQHCG